MNQVDDVYKACLGPFRYKGFTIEEDDHVVTLKHEGEVVDRFTIHASVVAIQNSCKYHLVKEHNADKSTLYKES